MADEAFGGTQAQGAYNRKDAYDAMELAVNRYILDVMKEYNDGTVENAARGIEAAQHILSLLPTQNVRTDEMEKFQQFSTPPSIAYLASQMQITFWNPAPVLAVLHHSQKHGALPSLSMSCPNVVLAFSNLWALTTYSTRMRSR